MKQRVEVVCGLVKQGCRYGVFQRALTDPRHPGAWELPGGKIEAGELAEVAIARELQEELEITVVESRYLVSVDWDYPHISIRLHCYMIDQWEGAISLLEHAAMRWLKGDALKSVEWAEADSKLIGQLLAMEIV